ncbi:MAG: sarcosine oxidase subunit beta [Candidatus Promineifilaceae bacterium]|jgi:sarcosine oxidase, subunit beta
MNEFQETRINFKWHEPKKTYDVIIIGGGGHGLSTAYYLATRHDITDVAVLERSYIGGGNSGRNTTVIRANYGIPEAVKFYQRSVDLYEQLEAETDRWIMHKTQGILWMCHSEAGMIKEHARAAVNRSFGASTDYVTPSEIKDICPQVDISGGGHYPVVGGSYYHAGATARHDRVNWALAEGANRRGVHIHQRTGVTDLIMDKGKVVGVQTNKGPMYAKTVLCAVGGHVTRVAEMAGLRLPIRTHPLQAYVTNHYEHKLNTIVASLDLLFYCSQTPRGEMLMGAEIDRQPSYNNRSGHHFLQSCSFRAMTVLPFLKNLRILRQWTGICDMSPDYSPIIGKTGVDGFLITTGWGTWGFKAIPVDGEQLAQLIATGKTPPLIEPFRLDRFARDRTKADRGSAGTH